MISPLFAGQLTVEQLVDRHDLACRPVRDLLVDYLRERQPGIDYTTLTSLATTAGTAVLERPGSPSPRHRLAEAAARTSSMRRSEETPPDQDRPHGRKAAREQAVTRESALRNILITVRAFYLDIAQWAADDPARWGPWAVPCPVRGSDIQQQKQKSRTKARMDQRTRERLPSPGRYRRRPRP